MTQSDLDYLLDFAKANNLMSQPFQKVYNLWLKELEEAYQDYLADSYLSSPDAIEAPYLDQAV